MISAACCVFDCPGGVPADQVDSGGRLTLFHPFPIGDPARLAEWCNLLMLEADSSFGEMYVCSSHFSPQQYDFSSDCKKPLKSDAVPDKNLPKIMLVEESPCPLWQTAIHVYPAHLFLDRAGILFPNRPPPAPVG